MVRGRCASVWEGMGRGGAGFRLHGSGIEGRLCNRSHELPLMQFFKKALGREPALHPIDQGLAKQWVKKRLLVVYPELRDDPKALEEAYQSLSMEPRLGTEEGDQAAYFEMRLP